jgi:hypothetical protein
MATGSNQMAGKRSDYDQCMDALANHLAKAVPAGTSNRDVASAAAALMAFAIIGVTHHGEIETMTDPNRLGDAPIEPYYRDIMNELAHLLDTFFNGQAKGKDRKTGFILMVFPFEESAKAAAGGSGRANYISNAKRDDVVIMLKEQIKRFEGQAEITGKA